MSRTEHEERLCSLSEIFEPHVRDLVAEEARRRTWFPLFGQPGPGWPESDPSVRNIMDRALAAEAKMLVREWSLLLAEHAADGGRVLTLSTLDDAMLPPLAPDLTRIFRECCGRRMAGIAITLAILRRVRAALPGPVRLPRPMEDILIGQGIRLVA